jgi:DNA-binding helix-hairpin-helix protein with protein kinase domain
MNVHEVMLPEITLPNEGSTVLIGNRETTLGSLLSWGGEGKIFYIDIPGKLCKIYHSGARTLLRKNKIELMTQKEITKDGISWPQEIVQTLDGSFLGFTMPELSGQRIDQLLFDLESLHGNALKRIDLVNVLLQILEFAEYLHQQDILIGDINPVNFLIDHNIKVGMIDVDSVQIENLPCPVGSDEFCAPEIPRDISYANYLRSMDDELFSVATLVFMILFPGLPPYAQQGTQSLAENTRDLNFPYKTRKAATGQTALGAQLMPVGRWQYVWGILPREIQIAFHEVFTVGNRISVLSWISLLQNYADALKAGKLSQQIFPYGLIPYPWPTFC